MLNSTPLVSIALATYNGATYLKELLDSIFKQTYTNFEVIISDDCSTDETISILEFYENEHTNLKIYRLEKNVGYIKNFENAFCFCRGDYIAPCDQDDVWLPDKIKRLVEEINSYPIIYCDSLIVDADLKPVGKKASDSVVCKTVTNCLEYTIFANIYGHASLFKRSVFENMYDFFHSIPYDWWLAYYSTFHGGAKFLPEVLVLYRQHQQNTFGVKGGKKRKTNKSTTKRINIENTRYRMNKFYLACPDNLVLQKKVLYKLNKSYQKFSFANNILRCVTFFKNYKPLLSVKKRPVLRKYLFCFKMFAKIK